MATGYTGHLPVIPSPVILACGRVGVGGNDGTGATRGFD